MNEPPPIFPQMDNYKRSVDNPVDSRGTMGIIRIVDGSGKVLEVPLSQGSSFSYLPWN